MLAQSTCVEEDNILLRCNLDRQGDVYFYPTHNEDLFRLTVERLEGFKIDMTNLPNVDYIHVMFGAGTCANLLGMSKTVTLDFNEMPPLHCLVGITPPCLSFSLKIVKQELDYPDHEL